MKVLSIVGACPDFIKVAALHRVIVKKNNLKHFILHTAQHYGYKMSEVFFNELRVPKPDFHLNINEPSHAPSTPRMIEGIDKILAAEKTAVVIVYGDQQHFSRCINSKKIKFKTCPC